MSLLSQVTSGIVHKPPRLIIYGTAGIGKTTLAAGAPKPILVQTEDGAEGIGVDRLPQCRTFEEMMDQLTAIRDDDHEYQTLILDSLDWAEKLVWDYTCRQNGWITISEPDYGKGYASATENWRFVVQMLCDIRDQRGIAVIMLAHSQIKRFEAPETGGYDRYSIDLHKGASSLVEEMSDGIFFMHWKTIVTEEKTGFAKVNKAKGNGTRLIFTQERPTAKAKSRFTQFGMPERVEIPNDPDLAFGAVSQFIPFFGH